LKSTFVVKTENILERHKCRTIRRSIIQSNTEEGFKALVLSEGSFVNGSSLINGLEQGGENKTSITGGMCGDDDRLKNSSFL
jgi:hypothetical protein